jgi:hypothetical protein
MNRIIVKYKYLMLLLTGVLTFASCSKETEPDPFTGKDSYITAFSLQQGEAVFHAAIAGEVITITVSEGFSLNQAKATVRISENATIYPDPSTITDWNEERQFAVTAYNSGQIKYKYTVKRNGFAHDGTVILETQADVDAFGQQGITLIDGNLTIGRTGGTDSITSLAPLADLREVAYTLTINPTFAGTGLDGLGNLEHAGIVQIGDLKHLEVLTLPNLKTVGGFSLQNTVTYIVELPELAGASKQFNLICPLYQLQLPSLKYAGGTVTINGSNATIAQISLPALEEAGSITFNYLSSVEKIDLPQLKKADALSCPSLAKLSFIYAPMLEEVKGRVSLASLAGLPEFELPELKRAGEVYISNCAALRVLNFPKLTSADNISLSAALVKGLEGFPALQSAGSVTVSADANTGTVVLPDALQRIDYLTVNSAAEEINIKGKDVGTLSLTQPVKKITGDEVFHGTLYFNFGSVPEESQLPLLEGFSEVDSIYIRSGSLMDVHVRGIRKVNKGFYITTNYSGYPYNFSLRDLEEVGGNLDIRYSMYHSTATALEIGSLQRVGGNFTMNVMTKTVDTLRFPALATIGGDFLLGAGYTSGSNFISAGTLLFPQLATIGGTLKIMALTTSPTINNDKLTDLDGFAALAGVKAIEVTGMAALTDYSGLRKLFENLAEDQWITPTNNRYNPAYQDLIDGKWTEE